MVFGTAFTDQFQPLSDFVGRPRRNVTQHIQNLHSQTTFCINHCFVSLKFSYYEHYNTSISRHKLFIFKLLKVTNPGSDGERQGSLELVRSGVQIPVFLFFLQFQHNPICFISKQIDPNEKIGILCSAWKPLNPM